MSRLLVWIAVILVIAFVALAVTMRGVSDEAEMWHVDPATTERTGRPNDYLAAPDGTTQAPTDRLFAPREMAKTDLLYLFDALVRPQADVLAGSVDEGHITYVQRSAVLGFPDYITVKTVETEKGAGLIIWSRSRFGYSDLGVNKKRIDGWLASL